MAFISPEDVRLQLKDPKFFIERFFWIVDKERVKVPFKFNSVQNKYYQERSHKDLILKARKEGITSLGAAIWAHACLFLPNSRCVIVSHEEDSTQRIFQKVKYYLDNMGIGSIKFKVELEDNSKKQISFPGTGSSFWIGTAGSTSFGRGDDITHLWCSEVPWWKNQDLLTGLLEACVPSAWTVLESTANGVGEAFHRMWKESQDPQSGSTWKRHFFPWYDDPSYRSRLPEGVPVVWTDAEKQMKAEYKLDDEQVYWYRKKRSDMADKEMMPQEFPSSPQEAFIASGRPVLDQKALAEMESKCRKPEFRGELIDDGHSMNFKEFSEGRISVWKMPRLREKFLIAADVAEGVQNGCYSVAKVFNRSSWECVAQFRSRIDPGQFGKELCNLGYFFNNALLLPEMNNHGWGTIERIKLERYPHLVNTKDIWPEGSMEKYGFPTNERTRNLIFSALLNAIEGRNYVEHDIVTIQEMQSLVRDDSGRIIVEDGYMDCAITAAIGIYALKFLTTDETYRSSDGKNRPIVVGSVIDRSKPKSRTGYR